MADKVDIDLTGGGAAAAVDADAQADLKQKLAKRMGLAVVLIAVLLGALAVFDRISSEPPDEADAPAGRPPVPLPRHEVAKPLQPPIPAGTRPDAAPVTVEKTSAPTTPAEPPTTPAEPPPKPEIQAQPLAPPPSPQTAARTSEGKPQPARAEPKAPAAVAEGSATPMAVLPAAPSSTTASPAAAVHSAPAAATAAPVAAAMPTPAAVAKPLPLPARPGNGYVLQAGVFSSAQRAEELHARLQLNGIASSIESRVQVGPFGSRAEADAARAKLKALGIESVLIPPRGSR